VQYNGKVIPARYTGVVPDTFKNASEVVLKGKLQDGGFSVEPNGVMAKCPSKYNPQTAAGS
jgi:cytochrome c-type biogenesis protein CcmE